MYLYVLSCDDIGCYIISVFVFCMGTNSLAIMLMCNRVHV